MLFTHDGDAFGFSFDWREKCNRSIIKLTWTALPDVVCITVVFGLLTNKTPLGMATGVCELLPAAVCITED